MEKNKQQIWRGIAIGLIYPSLCAVTELLSGKGLPYGPLLLRVIPVIAVLGGTALLIGRKGCPCPETALIPAGLWTIPFLPFPPLYFLAPELSVIRRVSGVIPCRTYVVFTATIYLAGPFFTMVNWLGCSLLLSALMKVVLRFARRRRNQTASGLTAEPVSRKHFPRRAVLAGAVPLLIWMISLGISHFCGDDSPAAFAAWFVLPILAGMLIAAMLWRGDAVFDSESAVPGVGVFFVLLLCLVVFTKDPDIAFLNSFFLLWALSVSADLLLLHKIIAWVGRRTKGNVSMNLDAGLSADRNLWKWLPAGLILSLVFSGGWMLSLRWLFVTGHSLPERRMVFLLFWSLLILAGSVLLRYSAKPLLWLPILLISLYIFLLTVFRISRLDALRECLFGRTVWTEDNDALYSYVLNRFFAAHPLACIGGLLLRSIARDRRRKRLPAAPALFAGKTAACFGILLAVLFFQDLALERGVSGTVYRSIPLVGSVAVTLALRPDSRQNWLAPLGISFFCALTVHALVVTRGLPAQPPVQLAFLFFPVLVSLWRCVFPAAVLILLIHSWLDRKQAFLLHPLQTEKE